MTFLEAKEQLLSYLNKEKSLAEQDIENHERLSNKEKVSQGFLIMDCEIISHVEGCYELRAEENNTKLRAGDRVVLTCESTKEIVKAEVIENFFDIITISTQKELDLTHRYNIHVNEAVLLAPFIKIIEDLDNGASGSLFIKELFNIESPKESGFLLLDPDRDLPSKLNDKQKESIKRVFLCPSFYCIQGPPGTGKTDVLSNIASYFSRNGEEVLIISNTHQAVNNALNKLSGNKLPLVKIGETIKAQDLKDDIVIAKNYNEYSRTRYKKKLRIKTNGDIVGMTLHAATINLGLGNTGFSPSIVLVDEAGQISLPMGSVIGTFGASSIIFIGDDRQMPPIFHPEMLKDPLSVSIFSYITNLYPNLKTVLDTTYRMNTEITEYVSRHFYEPHGITLKSNKNPIFENSIEFISIKDENNLCWKDYNPEEAKLASEKALEYAKKKFEVAIITPFRKQVNCIREFVNKIFKNNGISNLPLVDTVERLQGQDVDVIIISTSISDYNYYQNMQTFILEEHRLNVMFSRAKEKVIFIKSDIVKID